jgi:hypothetical protein
MKDFFQFVGRAASGGALAGATLTLLICLYYFGPSWNVLYLYHPMILACFAVPSAIVGLVLWIVTTLAGARLISLLRIGIGISVVPAIYFLIVLYALGGHLDKIDFTQFSFSTEVVWLLLWITVPGGIAGLAAPSRRRFTKDTRLTYWDRVALYEIAQLEARLAIQRRPHSIGG